MLCEVVDDNSQDGLTRCEEEVAELVDSITGHLLVCGYHAELFVHRTDDEVAIARAIAERERAAEWQWRTMWHNSKLNVAVWDEIHKPTNRNPIVSASAAANVFGFGYISRQVYYHNFFQGWPEPSQFMRDVFLRPGSENEPIAIKALLSELRLHSQVLGIDVEQRTWRGYGNEDFLAATPDGIVRTTDGDFAIEVKCPVSRVPFEPKPNHVLQILLQMHLFRYKYDPAKRLTKGYLYYWMGNATPACFLVRYDAKVLAEVVDAIRVFVDDIKNEKIPEKAKKDYFIKLVMRCV